MSNKLNYLSYGNSVDGTNYCSGLETLAENLIEDNEEDAVIVFPAKDGWASLRSTSYRMTTDNVEAVLPLPIYRIKKITLNVLAMDLYLNTGSLKNYTDENGNYLTELNITNYVVPIKEWTALPVAVVGEEHPYYGGLYKDNTFYWEEGSDTIAFVGTVYKLGHWFMHGFDGVDETPTYKRLLGSALYKIGKAYKDSAGTTLQSAVKEGFFIGMPDVRNWQFRIEYVPVSTKTKIRARKQAKMNVEYIQPFNQRAEINAASAFGKGMYLAAQKTGTREVTLVKNYTKLADIPSLGARIRHNGKLYRLVANHYKQTNTVYIQVMHVLSENWTNKSKHLSVDQKYRNWNIPQDILWRNLYWEDYLICSTKPLVITPSSSLGANEATMLFICGQAGEYGNAITNLSWLFDDAPLGLGVTVPCSTYGTANSMIFSAGFKDNLSAGLHKLSESSDLCEETYYCLTDGTLQSATVILSPGMGNGFYDVESGVLDEKESSERYGTDLSALARIVYPCIARKEEIQTDGTLLQYTFNVPKTELFRKKFKILKDSGEALKFTYQVHIVPHQDDIGRIIIGDKFAALNTLVKNWDKIRKLNLAFFTKYLRDGETRLTPTLYDTQTTYWPFFTYLGGKDEASIKLNTKNEIYTKALANGCVAWAICDEENNLILGCNDISKTEIYFYVSHARQ